MFVFLVINPLGADGISFFSCCCPRITPFQVISEAVGKVHVVDVELEAVIFAATPSLGEFGSLLGGLKDAHSGVRVWIDPTVGSVLCWLDLLVCSLGFMLVGSI